MTTGKGSCPGMRSFIVGRWRWMVCAACCLLTLAAWLRFTDRVLGIVVCHDYTLYRATCASGRCENRNDTNAATLRERLAQLGYKRFTMNTVAANDPELAGGLLKPNDVLILREAHSGFVNDNYRIDHYLQREGEIGVPREAMNLPLFPAPDGKYGGLFRGDTLPVFLDRPLLKAPMGSLEVWRRQNNLVQRTGRDAFDLVGTWEVSVTDQFGTESYMWVVSAGRSASTIDWRIRSTLLKTLNPARQNLVGQTWDDGYIEFRSTEGRWLFERNRGVFAFSQTAGCFVDNASITCEGVQGDFGRESRIKIKAVKSGGAARSAASAPPPTRALASATSIWARTNEKAGLGGRTLSFYRGTTSTQCQADCERNPNCAGYTFVRPGGYNAGDPQMCYLMSGVTDFVPSACCISAIKARR